MIRWLRPGSFRKKSLSPQKPVPVRWFPKRQPEDIATCVLLAVQLPSRAIIGELIIRPRRGPLLFFERRAAVQDGGSAVGDAVAAPPDLSSSLSVSDSSSSATTLATSAPMNRRSSSFPAPVSEDDSNIGAAEIPIS